MAHLLTKIIVTALVFVALCSSKPHKRDYPNDISSQGGGQGPFAGGLGRGGGQLNGQMPSSGGGGSGGGMGINPFGVTSNGATAGKSPFANAAVSGDGNGSGGVNGGPFANGMNNGGGKAGSPFASSAGNGGGMGVHPFSGGNAGNSNGQGASPFASAMSNGGASSNGASPFASAMLDKGSSPFNANMDNGGMPGADFSSLLGSGPGGLAGGDFLPKNVSMLMGHDFSKELGNDGKFGEMGSTTIQNAGVDNSRFDTTAYQQMLQGLFSTDNAGQGVKDMGTPFDGSSYNYNSNTDEHYNTAMEASVGSFASTGMSAYSGSSDASGEHAQSQYHGLQKGIGGQYPESGSSSYSGGSNIESGTSSSSDGIFSSPFNINNYDMSHLSSGGQTGSSSGINNGQSPFKINNYNTGKNPFSVNNDNNAAGSAFGNGVGTGSGPFDTSNFGTITENSNKQSGMGKNPFDTSNMLGNQQYQNMRTGNGNYNDGLDEYGNVNFGTLSGLSGNPIDAGAAGGLGESGYSSRTNSYSGTLKGSGTYNGFQESTGAGQYGVSNGIDYTGAGSSYNGAGSGYNTGSESQYETPFEADNYNDLLGNPFKSDSYFDSTRQNFKLPYETNSNLQQDSYSSLGASSGYGGNLYGAAGAGPGGDPFHQGGNSMKATNAMRGTMYHRNLNSI